MALHARVDSLQLLTAELVKQIKFVQSNTVTLLKICMNKVQRLNRAQDRETFLQGFIPNYRYLTRSVRTFSEINYSLSCLTSDELLRNLGATLLDVGIGDARDFGAGADGPPGADSGRSSRRPRPRRGRNEEARTEDLYRGPCRNFTALSTQILEEAAASDARIGLYFDNEPAPLAENNTPNSAEAFSEAVPELPYKEATPQPRSSPPTFEDFSEFGAYAILPNELEQLNAGTHAETDNVPAEMHLPHQTHADSPADIYIRPLEFDRSEGSVHDARLVHLVSPSEFYVHVSCEDMQWTVELESKLDSWKSMNALLTDIYGTGVSLPPGFERTLARRILGNYAIATDVNGSASRVRIVDWEGDGSCDRVKVFFVDRGNFCDWPLSLLHPMPAALAAYPALAERCYMPFVRPRNSTLEWTERDRINFELFLEGAETPGAFRIEVVESTQELGLGVLVVMPDTNLCINEKLIWWGLVSEVERTSRYMPLFAPGDFVYVKVICYFGVNKLLCVKDYEKTNEEDILAKITALLSEWNGDRTVPKAAKIGDIVLGKFKNGVWYRMKTLGVGKRGYVKVQFLDYGYIDTIPEANVRELLGKHLEYPFQMMKCILEDVDRRPDDSDTVTARSNLLRKIESGEIKIQIVSVVCEAPPTYRVTIVERANQDAEGRTNSVAVAAASTKPRGKK
ncbi:UNVERIFIED_CONTAM: hypothetical protein PYX00_000050 [Menopon gallinae]|uniref:Tudor domain-containing protein n=1 Tax=Menopon gallinae TaxID=328185 RepID=A0AAW2I8G8_9NEOP